MYYDNIAYAHERLSKTIVCTKDGTPVYVDGCFSDDITDERMCRVYLLSGGKKSSKNISLNTIDLTPVKLGYVNLQPRCVHVSRRPVRAFKQGLSISVLTFSSSTDGFRDWPFMPMHNTIKNIYPTLKECKKSLEDSLALQIAFCRDFSIDNTGLLFHCGETVGAFDGKRCSLNKNYTYLAEKLHMMVET